MFLNVVPNVLELAEVVDSARTPLRKIWSLIPSLFRDLSSNNTNVEMNSA